MAKIIIVTGTPGVGKTVLGKLLAEEAGYQFLSLGDLVKSEGLHKGFDRQAESYIVDERALEPKLNGHLQAHRMDGIVFETHFVSPIVHKTRGMVAIVLRLDPVLLARRLRARKWSKRKIWDNVEAELIDLSLYDSLKLLGKKRVFEIDATGKRPPDLVREVVRVLLKGKGWNMGSSSDWLEKYDPILLSRRIL